MKIDFSELDKLEVMLKEAGLPYERKDLSQNEKNLYLKQIIFTSDDKNIVSDDENIVSDVVIGYIAHSKKGFGTPVTYGAPLLEQMGLINEEVVGDMVEGGLTAETVFERWKKHYEEHKEEKIILPLPKNMDRKRRYK